MDLPFSLTMVTDASTPSATLTVTGESTVTPTAPSVTEEVSLGTSRSANGVPLSKMTFARRGAVAAAAGNAEHSNRDHRSSQPRSASAQRRHQVTFHLICLVGHR